MGADRGNRQNLNCCRTQAQDSLGSIVQKAAGVERQILLSLTTAVPHRSVSSSTTADPHFKSRRYSLKSLTASMTSWPTPERTAPRQKQSSAPYDYFSLVVSSRAGRLEDAALADQGSKPKVRNPSRLRRQVFPRMVPQTLLRANRSAHGELAYIVLTFWLPHAETPLAFRNT